MSALALGLKVIVSLGLRTYGLGLVIKALALRRRPSKPNAPINGDEFDSDLFPAINSVNSFHC